MNFLRYTIRRILATIPIILGVMFISFIMIRFLPPHHNHFLHHPWDLEFIALLHAYYERYGIGDPPLIQFYKYLTYLMGVFWTWLILVCSAGNIIFYAYKVVYEKIIITKNHQKFYTKHGFKRTVFTKFNGNIA